MPLSCLRPSWPASECPIGCMSSPRKGGAKASAFASVPDGGRGPSSRFCGGRGPIEHPLRVCALSGVSSHVLGERPAGLCGWSDRHECQRTEGGQKGGSVCVGGRTPHMPQWKRTSLMAGTPPPKTGARRQLERQDALLDGWRAQEAAWHGQRGHCRPSRLPHSMPQNPMCEGRDKVVGQVLRPK